MLKKVKGKVSIIICIIVISVAIVFAISGSIVIKNRNKATTDINNLSSSFQYVEFEIKLLTDCFAKFKYNNSSEEKRFYFASDGVSVTVVSLSEEEEKRLKNIIDYTYSEEEREVESVKIKGITQKIDKNLKQIIISSYKEIMSSDKLTEENFDEFIGNYYIDARKKFKSSWICSFGIEWGSLRWFSGIYYCIC